MRGFKFHPTVQGFDPSDEQYYPLYAEIARLGVPALFHTGQTGIGAGLPGGARPAAALSNPMLLDDVAAIFPDLQIVFAHPSVPWQDEAISIATHKPNAWIDLSGWSRSTSPSRSCATRTRTCKTACCSAPTSRCCIPTRWMRDFANLGLEGRRAQDHPDQRTPPARAG